MTAENPGAPRVEDEGKSRVLGPMFATKVCVVCQRCGRPLPPIEATKPAEGLVYFRCPCGHGWKAKRRAGVLGM